LSSDDTPTDDDHEKLVLKLVLKHLHCASSTTACAAPQTA